MSLNLDQYSILAVRNTTTTISSTSTTPVIDLAMPQQEELEGEVEGVEGEL